MTIELVNKHPHTGGGINPMRLWAVVKDEYGSKVAEVEVKIVNGVVKLKKKEA